MKSLKEVRSGAVVYSTDGVLGRVEGHSPPMLDGETAEGVLLVRSEDGARYYRVPATIPGRVLKRNGRPTVLLQASSAVLEGYIDTVRPPANGVAASPESAAGTEEQTLRIPLVAEELEVHTQPISLGRVHVHKGVEHVEQHLTIPVLHEEAIIERIAPEDYDATVPSNPDELIVPVMEEKIVFEKRTVVKEYIRIRKQRVQEEQVVEGTVRREYIKVTEQPSEAQDGPATSLSTIK